MNESVEDGIAPHEIRIGLLDFLRELQGGLEGIRLSLREQRFYEKLTE